MSAQRADPTPRADARRPVACAVTFFPAGPPRPALPRAPEEAADLELTGRPVPAPARRRSTPRART